MSGTSTTVVSASMIGETCSFQSKNPNDTIVWIGVIEALTTNVVAQSYSDILSYNAAVRQIDPTVPADLTQQTYMIITLSNAVGAASRQAFATDWIVNGSFSIVSPDAQVTVVVYDAVGNNHSSILTVLRAAGYSCYISGVTT